MLIAEINDNNCILGVDFLKLLGLQKIFDFIFLNSITKSNVEFNCSRIESITTILSNLTSLFEGSSQYLDELEKESFVIFLNEFRNVFFNEIIAGNCKVEHD